MGSGPSCYLASHNEIGGLALQSAFVSAFRIQTGIKLLAVGTASTILT
jgi:hypothetical protein